MLNVGVIGIGNCGNQVASLCHQKLTGCDVFAINTSETDLSTLPTDIPKKCVGDTEGSGKNRETAKKFLEASIMDLMRDNDFAAFMSNKEVIVIVSSMGGGSGSGIAPLMSKIVKKSFRTPDNMELSVILTGVMPKLSEGYSTQANTLGYIHELYDVLEDPTYMIFDNNNFAKMTAYKILETVNDEIVECIRVIQCWYNNPTPYDSIDEKDMKTLLSTPGRLFIAPLLDIKEKDVDEVDIEDLLIDKIKSSAHAELQRDGVVYQTGLITNLSAKLNEKFDSQINKVRAFIGEPSEEFLHTAVNAEKTLPNNVILILTGLSKISDRVDKIRDRVDEVEQKKNATEASEVAVSKDELDRMNAGRKSPTEANDSGEVNLRAIFDEFK
jgi:cell division GTPase FtsZ